MGDNKGEKNVETQTGDAPLTEGTTSRRADEQEGSAAPEKEQEAASGAKPAAAAEKAEDAGRKDGGKHPSTMTMRIVSGAIYAIGTVACLFLGTWPTAILIAVMAFLCCSEFLKMSRRSGRMPNDVIALAFAVIFPFAPLSNISDSEFFVIFALLVVCALWYVSTPRANMGDVALTVFGPIYTSLAFSSIVIIRDAFPGWRGALLTFAVMGSIWLSDSCAYFVGSKFGKHKLAPRISPNKSVEGFWGGMVGSVAVWVVVFALGIYNINLPYAIVCGVLVDAAAVAGDLFESRIKRGVGVKDSGNLMPGHGGMLDRSDSLLFGGMTAFLLLRLGGIL
ncbi:phosphatidate cytidylyltransferase [Parafannyhessea umbonata]|uniref:phosphatidate cytidylyltransferase n=1 Tax=Parafannyhessea TaxID=2847312 RepID=UPI001F169D95|nr:phosphatidate cytidylyltransferase [Parafannyhessea umbonata]